MKAVYKCRLCGESYGDLHIGDENVICLAMIDVGLNGHSSNAGFKITRYDVHCCKSGNYGFADFQGFVK